MDVLKSWASVERAGGIVEDDVFYQSDGLKIHAVLGSDGTVRGKPAAVLLHGFRSDAEELSWLGRSLAAYGWASLRLDFRGRGLSDGSPDDINGYVHDAIGALDLLVSLGVDSRHVYAVGQSLGSAVAITCGTVDARVAGVAALHPTDIHDLGAYNPPVGHPDVRRPIDIVSLLSPRPILIIAGEHDLVLPCSRALELYHAAREPKRMLEVKDGSHSVEDTEAYVLGWLLAGTPHV